ncbi:hypothetical protein M408DRAFT_23071 [Serendipita vermifera MAFF 305830]|uniref:Uncharacterized protein n=1 Tax=Serendipita vermifera MAFF 305830 TaxID=933852 RepID=A0A0C3BAZ4_SERVB|nr:hypothetical protein M408DRAFT_23071 [Serendipita vermifera MAFF 305830]
MWTPPDPNSLPSQSEVACARNAILELEKTVQDNLEIIEQAKITIAALEKEIEGRRAWIAPIRKLPIEILAEIFVHCSSLSELAPVTVSEVCRLWHQAILATPQAWCLIDFGRHKKEEDESNYLSSFFERSKPWLVHLWISKQMKTYSYDQFYNPIPLLPSALINPHLNRVSCLNIRDFEMKELSDVVFPTLSRLELAGYIENGFPLDKAHFPSLSYLDCCDCELDPGPTGTEYPPLQYLSFYAAPDRRWVQVVKGCSSSLQALKTWGSFIGDDVTRVIKLELPILTYLSLEDILDNDPKVAFRLQHTVTPKLLSYEEKATGMRVLSLHGDVKHVKHLRTDSISTLSGYPSLRFLQLEFSWDHKGALTSPVEELVKLLREDPSICPAIETIEIFPSYSIGRNITGIWERLKVEADEMIQTPRPWIKLSFIDQPGAIPGSLSEVQCKHGLPY